jgi:uncharacterized protein (TIGR00730 family)
MKRVAVFCGANVGAQPLYAETARLVARLLVERGLGVVFGGGRIGLMGALADAALEAGGEVIGVIPQALVDREQAHGGLTELNVVSTMHERKALMTQRSEAFLALPGGFGTMDELFEAITWRQLGYHDKPAAVLNVAGFYDGLEAYFERAAADGFISSLRTRVLIGSEPAALLDRLIESAGIAS